MLSISSAPLSHRNVNANRKFPFFCFQSLCFSFGLDVTSYQQHSIISLPFFPILFFIFWRHNMSWIVNVERVFCLVATCDIEKSCDNFILISQYLGSQFLESGSYYLKHLKIFAGIELIFKRHRRLVKSLLWNILYNFCSVVSFVVCNWYLGQDESNL